ncbi:MAG: helix-turn-helix transcriptional regulator [Sphingomonadales bacterium]|nr:helix-turn-helix transcriptional regulator [Sphingomonadales bacterium]
MGGAIDPAFSDLLARLYAGIGEERPWQAFLEALARWMDATFATLIITAPGRKRPATFLTPGGSPEFNANYTTSLFADDPFQGLPDGQVTSYAEFMATLPDDAFPEYRRTMIETGFDRVLGVDLHFGKAERQRADDGRYEARFRISRHNSLPDFTRAERAQAQAIVPHLRIAVNLFERLQFAGAQHGMFHSTAQGLGLALLILDRNRRIVSSNALADRVLTEAEGLKRRSGELVLEDAVQHRMVGDLLAGREPGAPVPRFRIERPRHGDLVVTARTLDLSAIHSGAGALALFLARPGAETSADPQALRDLLGLTAAEAKLAAVLAEGHTLVEAARRLGVAHNTAKVQLRAVFAKTGVHRQSQLVVLLASLNG